MNLKTPLPTPRGETETEQRHRRDRELVTLLLAALGLLLLLLLLFLPLTRQDAADTDDPPAPPATTTAADRQTDPNDEAHTPASSEIDPARYMPVTTDSTQIIADGTLDASHAILVDLTTGESIAQRLADERIYPASMTKIMTVLVACEQLTAAELESTVTITEDIINAAIRAGASRAGFDPGERVKLIDLLYGAALPSGADATAALAQYLAGGEEAYVELMNQKADALELNNTHFVNASGLHDDDHYSTVREIAALMAYAMENELCRTLLSAASYTTASTEQHPYGITLYSTTFSRMTTTAFGPVNVIAGKTGYTDEARFCLASLATRADGREYILVTVGGSTKYAPVADCDAVYGKYLF